MQAQWPLVRDLVLIGGGHAHALVLRAWGMRPQAGVRLTLINPEPAAPYTGMLPGHVAGHYTRDEMMIDLVRLARFAGARLILDRACGLDPDRRVLLASGRSLRYDAASIDIGIGSGMPELPGFAEHATAAKPLGDYARQWSQFLDSAGPTPRVVIIGAGVGGCELAMASAHRLARSGRRPDVTLLERNKTPLPGLGRGARAALMARLAAHGVTLRTGVTVQALAPDAVLLEDGNRLPSDFTLTVAGARPQPWLAQTHLDLTDGFVTVGATLQTSDPAIFAAGDCAHMTHAPRPKAGVFAVRQAPVLHHNLRAALSGAPLRRYQPQRDYLKLISTGDRHAVADKLGLRLEGGWLWRWKDRIDRAFMAKFETYPEMPAPVPPAGSADGLAQALGPKPLCGGCGAKVGAGVLSGVLADLPAQARADVIAGPGDDAALLDLGGGRLQALTTDHLRAFTADPALMARITAVHALGDVLAMGASPQAALAQITLPPASDALQADMLAEILHAASQVFAGAGAAIIGGHSSIGAELAIGFTVTGLAARALRKGGAQPGDALILTRPLGSGTLLAADMARTRLPGLLLGEAVSRCLAAMATPQTAAAAVLAPAAHAMTDVTGFGLAGHLMEMMTASGTAATLRLADIPLYAGAEAAAALGIASSLAPANRAALLGRIKAPATARAALLYDPQTAGGLLAAVPADLAESLCAELSACGTPATRIGSVTAGPPFLTVTD